MYYLVCELYVHHSFLMNADTCEVGFQHLSPPEMLLGLEEGVAVLEWPAENMIEPYLFHFFTDSVIQGARRFVLMVMVVEKGGCYRCA